MRCPGVTRGGPLSKRESLGLRAASGQLLVEPLHQPRCRDVGDRPQRRHNVRRPGVEEPLHQSHPVIARWDVRQRSGADSGLTRAQHEEASVQREPEYLVHLEAPVLVAPRAPPPPPPPPLPPPPPPPPPHQQNTGGGVFGGARWGGGG